MYDIWCEVKKINVIFLVGSIGFIIGDLILYQKLDYRFLILSILFTLNILKATIKYFKLKAKGILIEEVPYVVQTTSRGAKILIIEYNFPDGVVRKLFKKWSDNLFISNTGKTKMLVDMENPKNYYIFMPED